MFWRSHSGRGACARAQRMLADHSVGLLRGAQESWLNRHLMDCPSCRAEQEILFRVVRLVDSMPPLSPSPGMWQAIEARIRTPEGLPAPGASRRWALAPALATTAALAFIAGISLRRDATPTLPFPPPDTIGYVQTHALMTGTDPLADRVGLVSYATLAGHYGPRGVSHR